MSFIQNVVLYSGSYVKLWYVFYFTDGDRRSVTGGIARVKHLLFGVILLAI